MNFLKTFQQLLEKDVIELSQIFYVWLIKEQVNLIIKLVHVLLSYLLSMMTFTL
jgi:hypothetical protein